MAHVHNLIVVIMPYLDAEGPSKWMTKGMRDAWWERRKYEKKHGKPRPWEWYQEPRDPRLPGRALGQWESTPTYIGPSRSDQISDRWQRARDSRGWKARLSDNPRARRAQIAWRFRNSHLYSYAPRSAVNKFLRRAKGDTFESPYIKPKDYPF
jgi:hypothetical protein